MQIKWQQDTDGKTCAEIIVVRHIRQLDIKEIAKIISTPDFFKPINWLFYAAGIV